MNVNDMMDSINSNKGEIARAISLAFADGNEEKSKNYFDFFYKSIGESKIFIFKNNDFMGPSEIVNIKLDKISDLIGYDVRKKTLIGEKTTLKNLFFDYKEFGILKQDYLKLETMYLFNQDAFVRLGISFADFIKDYKEKGLDHSLKLVSLIREVKRLSYFAELGSVLNDKKENVAFRFSSMGLPSIVKKYNIKSLDDVREFYKEICASLIDVSVLNEQEKIIIEEKKEQLKRRLQVSNLNYFELKKIKKKLEELYKNENMNKCINESNLMDFFARNNLKFTKSNLETAFFLYYTVNDTIAYNTRIEFDEGTFNFSIFKESALKKGYRCQNEVVIHELIHSAEASRNIITNYAMNMNCGSLNEVLTQYFTFESLKYMQKNVVDGETVEGPAFNCCYNCLLPMLMILKNSSLWDDLVYCKIMNDYSLLIDRIGSDALKISGLFDDAYSYYQSGEFSNASKCKHKLKVIVEEVMKKNNRYNKK